ncbi:hypothetical protein [Streptomyces sp. NPDC058572]|uniref:hypothetical protein n=1 Tax=Streptomyces sp. NPDC058572 TaxID=3346546 RepID=UPI003666A092
METEARRYPAIATLVRALGEGSEAERVQTPADCTRGFVEAYFARPEGLLDRRARQACSAWSFVDDAVHERFTGASAT